MNGRWCQAVNCPHPAASVPARLELSELSECVQAAEIEINLCQFHEGALREAGHGLSSVVDREVDVDGRETHLDNREADLDDRETELDAREAELEGAEVAP
jgi:hypothetical protein